MTSDNLDNLSYLKFLLSIEGIGPQKILTIVSKFNSIESFVESSWTNLNSIDGINHVLSKRLIESKSNYQRIKDETEKEIEDLSKLKARFMTYWDEDYPVLLKEIFYPPILLYLLGSIDTLKKNTIAIVGTRMPTSYGKYQAESMARELALNNIVVVSGLARGIDSIAHNSALKSGGKTIAVIGSGIDVIYPPENKNLFNKIIEQGLIISEYPLGTKPDAQNFPKRNRIISGVSLGTLIVETRLNGGAMQTAAYAIDQNREIYAIPGNINSKQSEGPNSLIQRGEAKLVLSVDDILDELINKLDVKKNKKNVEQNLMLNLFEEKIIAVLNEEPKHIDEISKLTSLSVSDCLVNLLILEFKGIVKQLPGKVFSLD
ncbi:MAG: DNA-processing protein DprA [Bacteroidota bacterium]